MMKRIALGLVVLSSLLLAGCCCCFPVAPARSALATAIALAPTEVLAPELSPTAAGAAHPRATPTAPPPAKTASARPTIAATREVAPTGGPDTPAPTAAPASPIVFAGATAIFYDISGNTAAELRDALNAAGPTDGSGARWDAMCNWDFWWSWPGTADGSCDLANVKVTYEVRVTFPHWLPPPGADPDLIARWEAYTQALAAHEQGHVDRAIEGVPTIADAIRTAGCDTANQAAYDATAHIQAVNDAYDAETDHGAAQGATFP